MIQGKWNRMQKRPQRPKQPKLRAESNSKKNEKKKIYYYQQTKVCRSNKQYSKNMVLSILRKCNWALDDVQTIKRMNGWMANTKNYMHKTVDIFQIPTHEEWGQGIWRLWLYILFQHTWKFKYSKQQHLYLVQCTFFEIK